MINPKKWTEQSNKIFRNEGKMEFQRYLWFFEHMVSPAELLEIGFNTGEALSWFADQGFKCTGIDLPDVINQYGKDNRIEYIIQNMDEPNAVRLAETFLYPWGKRTSGEPKHFDFIICSEVIQHLLFDENCLYAIWHYLKDGGKLLLSTEKNKLVSHGLRYYDPNSLIRILETLQFKIEDISTQGQPGYIWICARKYL